MLFGTNSHQVFSARAQAAGYAGTLTNRTMNTAVAFYTSPGASILSAITDREATAQALSRADLLIPMDEVVHVFELKPESQLADPKGRKAAAAQVANYVRILKANGVDAVPGDPKLFSDLFTGAEWVAGVVSGPGLLSRQSYSVTVSDSGRADGLIGYRLDDRGRVDTAMGEVLRGVANQDMGTPFMIVPLPRGMPGLVLP